VNVLNFGNFFFGQFFDIDEAVDCIDELTAMLGERSMPMMRAVEYL